MKLGKFEICLNVPAIILYIYIYRMRIQFVYCLLLLLLLSFIIIQLKCLYYFCVCRKAQEQVNHLSEIRFCFLPPSLGKNE